jgi:hypothetical protein
LTGDSHGRLINYYSIQQKLKSFTTTSSSTTTGSTQIETENNINMGTEEEILGLLTWGAVAAGRAVVTHQAAKSEGISFEEMRLRERAARNRSRATSCWTARGRRNAAARAAACDEQINRFEETRRKKMNQAEENPQVALTQGNNVNIRYCTHCGVQNCMDAKFCKGCGTPCNQGNYITTTTTPACNPNYKPENEGNYPRAYAQEYKQ